MAADSEPGGWTTQACGVWALGAAFARVGGPSASGSPRARHNGAWLVRVMVSGRALWVSGPCVITWLLYVLVFFCRICEGGLRGGAGGCFPGCAAAPWMLLLWALDLEPSCPTAGNRDQHH